MVIISDEIMNEKMLCDCFIIVSNLFVSIVITANKRIPKLPAL